MLSNEHIAWQLDWSDGRLQARMLDNWLTGHAFPLQDSSELALVLSSAPDRLQEPLTRVADFEVRRVVEADAGRATFDLVSLSTGLEVRLHYELDGPSRRKWVEVHNAGAETRLILDTELDNFGCEAPTSGGGQGQPLFIADEAFAAVEYPSGENRAVDGRVTLAHFPGCVLPPGGRLTSQTAAISVAESGRALAHFLRCIQDRCQRPKRVLSVYTPFGINNQWGPCPTLDDEETLHVLDRLAEWQRKGVRFDYFTLDTGWVDPSSDLTRFRPTCYPNGPQAVIERVKELGMKFGLWFAVSWGAESCWDYPPAWAGQEGPAMGYLNGCPAKAHCSGSFCLACDPYADLLKNAVLHHIRENGVRFVKLDGGNYVCDNPAHDHLPGKYSTERMFERLIDLADAARAEAPDVFVMWYWGLRSPFWALHGDSIFESGLHMEGSGTSAFPTLHYRDSVTLAQDQNAQHARTIPPLVKDSLGVWLADTRWGNFMGKRRWREALVMDLGRGSLLFPNLWGDVYLLDEDDVRFLAWIGSLARKNEDLFLNRRTILGDPWRNEVYGYAHCRGSRGFLFVNNAHFASRRIALALNETLGLEAKAGTPLVPTALFPERQQVLREDGSPYRAGDVVELWLRPFEVLMLEVKPARARAKALPRRQLGDREAADLGVALSLRTVSPIPQLSVEFVDAARLAAQGFTQRAYSFEACLPYLAGPQPILAVVLRLRREDEEWRYSPVVAEIAQVRARIGERNVQLVPVPDARQFGNTQKAGCSWIVYWLRLSQEWTSQSLAVAVHAWLPADVEAHTEAWVVRRWWREDARPAPDGYYADAPS
ncbi:MAG: hypothetical protein FJX75_09085 [Armatimonadetes bacterium]|nr:hypothetical protein [Armatimonadota bacterium]